MPLCSKSGDPVLFHAHIVDWSYPAHSHDTWTILIVDHGAIDYSLDSRRCAAVETTVAILPPGGAGRRRPLGADSRPDTSPSPPGDGSGDPRYGDAHELRLLLDEHATEPLQLGDAAATLDRSVSHLVRSFTASFGVSPHAYLVGRRIDAARPLLLAGVPLAQVATAVGFYDQAHFTRHFKRHVSTTPARYAGSHP